MPRVVYIILLGVIQGITEFLPVSSSGHLVIAQRLFGIESPGAGLEIALHFGTLVAILAFYREELTRLLAPIFRPGIFLKSESAKRIGLLIVASIPAGVVGILFERYITSLFDTPRFAAGMLLVTAAILGATALVRRRDTQINLPRAVVIGLAQALAIVPGISRSGSTIGFGRLLGIDAEDAARFSFILAIPAIAGATLLEILKHHTDLEFIFIIGTAAAALVGYVALTLLIGTLKAGKLWAFAPYCAVVGIVGLIVLT